MIFSSKIAQYTIFRPAKTVIVSWLCTCTSSRNKPPLRHDFKTIVFFASGLRFFVLVWNKSARWPIWHQERIVAGSGFNLPVSDVSKDLARMTLRLVAKLGVVPQPHHIVGEHNPRMSIKSSLVHMMMMLGDANTQFCYNLHMERSTRSKDQIVFCLTNTHNIILPFRRLQTAFGSDLINCSLMLTVVNCSNHAFGGLRCKNDLDFQKRFVNITVSA